MDSKGGHIELIIGPMFSGKSTELQRRIKRHTIAKRDCIVVKYFKDTRYAVSEMATHDHQLLKATATATLESVYESLLTHDVVGIDEGQFFPDVVEVSDKLAEKGKVVIISALDATFQRKPFGRILELIPMCEQVAKLTAVCAGCGKDASFSQRLTCEEAVEVIGGSEMYRPVCRDCFSNTKEVYVRGGLISYRALKEKAPKNIMKNKTEKEKAVEKKSMRIKGEGIENTLPVDMM